MLVPQVSDGKSPIGPEGIPTNNMKDSDVTSKLAKSPDDGGEILDCTKSIIEVDEIFDEPTQVTRSENSHVNPKGVQDVEVAITVSEVKRPEGAELMILTIALMLSVFVMSLDKSIIGMYAEYLRFTIKENV